MNSTTRINLLAATILAVLGFVLYSGSLQAPWYFDDQSGIVDNSGIHHIGNAFENLLRSRGLVNLTFALNYHFGGLSTFGYHLVNMAIHITASFVAFMLFRRFWCRSVWLPLLAAMIFLAHPVQTQAVTYIIQRMTSLAGLFYLLSVFFYFQFRGWSADGEAEHGRFLDLVFCFFFAALCILSKENTATLPVLLLAVELVLRPGSERGLARYKYVLVLLAVPTLLVLQQYAFSPTPLLAHKYFYTFYLENLAGGSTYAYIDTELLRYRLLFTQFIVIWKYVILYLFPHGLTLEYGYPVVAKLLNPRSLGGLAAIVGSLGLAWSLRRRNPTVAFGIFWFFITISVEASVLPLDSLYVHRLYVPSFGLVLVAVEILRRLMPQKVLVGTLVFALVAVGAITIQRNRLWSNPVAFWSDNVDKAPHNFRPRSHLALSLEREGRLREALEVQKEVVNMVPSSKNYTNLGRYYLNLGDYANAGSIYKMLTQTDAANALNFINYSIVLGLSGDLLGSLDYARKAYTRAPNDENVLTHLGTAYARVEDWPNAEFFWRRALSVNPHNKEAAAKLSSIPAGAGRQ